MNADSTPHSAQPLPSGYWEELTTTDFARLDVERNIALLPVSACEQHGPHLPLATDAIINAGVIEALLSNPPAQAGVLVLPAIRIGDSIEHTAFAGTLSVGLNTLVQLWLDMGRSASRAGIRKMILFNTHGGQRGHVDQVATRLRVDQQMMVARANSGLLGKPAGVFSDNERAHGLHGGAIETSMMLHLRPDLVRMANADNFVSNAQAMADRHSLLAFERGVGIGWMAQDLNTAGVCGDATTASADKGAALVAHTVRALATLCDEMAATSLDVLR